MADDWQTVAVKPRRQPETRASASRGAGIDVGKFISTFKTRACTDEKHHDWFQCPFFHGKGDKRRDPFEVAYLPDDAGLTGTEKAYHPANFRTKYCETFIRTRKCKYGAYCAFAHADDELRQPTRYEEVMRQKLYPSKPLPQVREFLPDLAQSVVQPPEVFFRPSCPEAAQPLAFFLPLTSFEVKVLRHSKMTLWRQFLDVAVEHMCKINLEILEKSDGVSLRIQGQDQNARSARSKLENQLRPLHKKYGETGTKSYPQKVMGLLSDLLEKDGPERFTERKDFELVEIHLDLEKRRVMVCALALPEVSRPMQVFHRIDRWIRDNEYDTTMNCESCMDDFNKRQGVTCVEGHFFCAECMERMLNAQLQSIGSQKGNVLCAICRKEVDPDLMRKICGKETWKKFQDAIIDARVEAHVQKMQKAFDERLQKKVDELIESYGNEEHSIKLQADKYAQEARNSALNLHCPHCKQVYSEFDGCMALECAHCKGHFCGYCHKALASSRGAHDHVRECDANLTSNGSYYATPEQIREGQRRFRVKQLKKFFEEKQMKQRIRNATIIELGRDLDDLGVEPAALFNFGNLQG